MAEKIREVCEKCNQAVQWNILREKQIFKKHIRSSWSFLDLEPYFSRILAKTIQRGCYNCILGVQRKSFSRSILFKYLFFIMLVCLVEKVSIFDKRFSAGCSNLYSTCPEESLRSLFLEKFTLVFVTFKIWAKNYPAFGPKFSASSLKLHLTSPVKSFEHLLEKKTFLLITSGSYKQKTIRCSVGEIRQAGQKVNLGFQAKVLRKKFFLVKICKFFLLFFGLRAKFFQNHGEKTQER